MPRVHTHYDNLKVARDAPMEVIHAAYKSLAAMYPDRHGGSEETARIRRIIDTSYLALCDPVRKRDHDRWIAEADLAESVRPSTTTEPPRARKNWLDRHALKLVGGFILALTIYALYASFSSVPPAPSVPGSAPTAAPTFTAVPTPETPPIQLRPRYVRPTLTPNGKPWPVDSGYIPGYAQVDMNGRSSLTVDNQQNSSDVLAKFFYRPPGQPKLAYRIFFLRGGEQFTVQNINAGPYDLRYQDLDSGHRFKSDLLHIKDMEEQIQEGDRIGQRWCCDTTITLYPTPDGTIHFAEIGPDEF
jgi:hypothetical protein